MVSFSAGQKVRASQLNDIAQRGIIGVHRPTANVTGSGTTEKVGCFVTFNAVTGRKYKATWNGDLSGSNSNGAASIGVLLGTNPVVLRLRVKAGASSTAVDGTLFDQRDGAGLSNGYNLEFNVCADWTSTITGQVTISLTFAAGGAATGNVTQAYGATAHTPKLIIEDCGS